MTAKDHIKEKLIISKEDWLREMEEYASIKCKELEKQLQKEAMKQLSLLDQIKELEDEYAKLIDASQQLKAANTQYMEIIGHIESLVGKSGLTEIARYNLIKHWVKDNLIKQK